MPPERGRGARCERKARQLGRELKLPGLSQGQGARAAGHPAHRSRGGARGGRARHALGGWYADAIETRRRSCPSAIPQLDLGELPAAGRRRSSSRSRSACCRRPSWATTGLEVGAARAEVADEQIEQEIEAHARAPGAPGDRRSARPARATSSSSTTSAACRAWTRRRARPRSSRSRAARVATSWSSSAPAT